MAAKRISQSAINWSALTERVPLEQKANLAVFKAKSDGYLRRVLSNPAEPPKLDWAYYKQRVPIAGMVDKFQQQYEALKIAYPQDSITSQVDTQWNQVKQEIENFVKQSESTIKGYEEQIKAINSLLPFNQMTMEDFRDSYPEVALDPINKPTFWPHNPEEQLDYVDPDKPVVAQGAAAH